MNQVQFAGSWYQTLTQAAVAWAATALPDTSVVGREENAEQVARDLEAFWWGEAQRIGEGAPEDVDEDEWREACRDALASRIDCARKAA